MYKTGRAVVPSPGVLPIELLTPAAALPVGVESGGFDGQGYDEEGGDEVDEVEDAGDLHSSCAPEGRRGRQIRFKP